MSSFFKCDFHISFIESLAAFVLYYSSAVMVKNIGFLNATASAINLVYSSLLLAKTPLPILSKISSLRFG